MPAEELYEETCPASRSENLRLHPARVATYKGLVFADLRSTTSPSLDDYLGDFRWYLDILLDNDEDGTEFLDGNIKSQHAAATGNSLPRTSSATPITLPGPTIPARSRCSAAGVGKINQERSYHANMNGHGWQFSLDMVGNAMTLGEQDIVDYLRVARGGRRGAARQIPLAHDRLDRSTTTVPEFLIPAGHNAFRTWIPKGPHETEIHTWVLVNKNIPFELKEKYRKGVMRTFSPSGIFEMDDGENWEHATQSNAGVVTRRQKLHYGLGLNSKTENPDLKGDLYLRKYNDANQRGFYNRWLQLMTAP